jgi:ribonuclease BN (tRNA processing enzyme)
MKTIRLGVLILCVSLCSTTPAIAQLTATIIGSGSPAYDEDRASASVLISNGDTQILVDMGNGAQANLRALGVNPSALSALLVTHHHLDHNEEFVPLLIHSLMGRQEFKIYGPPNTVALTESNLELYAEDIDYRLGKTGRALEDRRDAFSVHDIQGGEAFDVGEIQVSTLEVPHTIHAIAYRFDSGGESYVVTGDLTYTEALPGFAQGADFLIIDSGGMIMEGASRGRQRSGRSGPTAGRAAPRRERAHLNLAESSSMASQANVSNLVYTHFTPGDVDQEASLGEIRKIYGGYVTFGEDLMVLSNAHSATSIAETAPAMPQAALQYPIVDTGQERFYGDAGEIPRPGEDEAFYGQDADFTGNTPSYSENGDGTISDLVTGLMWQKGSDVLSYDEALEYADEASFGGHDDWRVPSIKEMYSLILFDGVDPSGRDMDTVPRGTWSESATT